MAKSKLIFPKSLFSRWSEKDFSDDGTNFRMYRYLDVLPISVTRAYFGGIEDEVFVCIRSDYLGIPYERKCELDLRELEDEFNGVYFSEFNMNKFIDNCRIVSERLGLIGRSDIKDKEFVITGKLNTFTRNEIIERIESLGGIVSGRVNSYTDYLITNDPNSGSQKNQLAKEYGTCIINEKELIRLLNNA